MFIRVLLLSWMAIGSSICDGGFVITISQVGSDVEVTGSGSINTASLNLQPFFGAAVPSIFPAVGEVWFSPIANPSGYVGIFSGPVEFGTGAGQFATSNIGQTFGFMGGPGPNERTLFLGDGYVSQSAIFTSMTFSGESLASLGLEPGSATWTFGAGQNADFVTIQINSVPEPTGLGAVALVLACLGKRLVVRRRSLKSADANGRSINVDKSPHP